MTVIIKTNRTNNIDNNKRLVTVSYKVLKKLKWTKLDLYSLASFSVKNQMGPVVKFNMIPVDVKPVTYT